MSTLYYTFRTNKKIDQLREKIINPFIFGSLKKDFEIDGKTAHYNMGVSLYNNTKEVDILGFSSLEESLRVLYGNGGYLYHFDKDKFLYKEGLGNLEVIVEEPTKPVVVERIDDPVAEMKKLGVTFKFTDLALSENEEHRNYY